MTQFSYCINALCDDRKNDFSATHCKFCNASLLINERYRLTKILRPKLRDKRLSVYEGIDTKAQEAVILKIDEMLTKHSTNFLRREFQVLTCFSENLFPRIHKDNYFEWHPVPDITGLKCGCLVLPKIDGLNSSDWIAENGPISQEIAIDWILKLVPYLRRLNQIAYLHRDIKPSNIMVSPNGSDITLIDYETCRKMDDEYMSIISANIINEEKKQYRKITRVFSSGYTAPEQNDGRPIPQSDYYSLGRTIIHWVTGVPPSKLVDFESNKIDWSKAPQAESLDQCFLNFLDRLCHPNAQKRPLNIDKIDEFLQDELPKQIKKERRKHSKLFKSIILILLALSSLGILGLLIAGTALYFAASGAQALVEKEYKTAKYKLERSLSIYPFNVSALQNLARACEYLENTDCVKEKLIKAIKIERNNSSSYYLLGLFYDKKQNYVEALKYYQKAVDIQPNDTEALNKLGRLKIISGHFNKAREILEQALEYENKFSSKHNNEDKELVALIKKNLGWVAFKQKNYQTSIAYLNESTELWIKNADGFCLIAKNLNALERGEEAKAYWDACLSIPSDTPEGSRWQSLILKNLLK